MLIPELQAQISQWDGRLNQYNNVMSGAQTNHRANTQLFSEIQEDIKTLLGKLTVFQQHSTDTREQLDQANELLDEISQSVSTTSLPAERESTHAFLSTLVTIRDTHDTLTGGNLEQGEAARLVATTMSEILEETQLAEVAAQYNPEMVDQNYNIVHGTITEGRAMLDILSRSL